MRTTVISMAILFMMAFCGSGVASADVWDPPAISNDMQQFLSTDPQWYPEAFGSSQWVFPRTAPPESAWGGFESAAT